MNILRLNLCSKWYNMIESGEKREEYREIKEYWVQRLKWSLPKEWRDRLMECTSTGDYTPFYGHDMLSTFDAVEFVYGYTKRTMLYTLDSISIGKPKWEWSEHDGDVFILKIGNRIDIPQEQTKQTTNTIIFNPNRYTNMEQNLERYTHQWLAQQYVSPETASIIKTICYTSQQVVEQIVDESLSKKDFANKCLDAIKQSLGITIISTDKQKTLEKTMSDFAVKAYEDINNNDSEELDKLIISTSFKLMDAV